MDPEIGQLEEDLKELGKKWSLIDVADDQARRRNEALQDVLRQRIKELTTDKERREEEDRKRREEEDRKRREEEDRKRREEEDRKRREEEERKRKEEEERKRKEEEERTRKEEEERTRKEEEDRKRKADRMQARKAALYRVFASFRKGLPWALTGGILAGVGVWKLKPNQKNPPDSTDKRVQVFPAPSREPSKQVEEPKPPEIDLPAKVALPNGVDMEFQRIKKGSFTMGSPLGNRHISDENQVEVSITQAFSLGTYEVTQRQWKAFMPNNPSFNKGDELPVEQVSWSEAKEFCKRLTEHVVTTDKEKKESNLPDGYVFNLPSEAQWEYACRAGEKRYTRFHFGETLFDNEQEGKKHAVFSGNNTSSVRSQRTPNNWNLHDMHGNVLEWCEDWYYKDLIGGKDPVALLEPPDGRSLKVQRGGGFNSVEDDCRSARRGYADQKVGAKNVGFRVAVVPKVEPREIKKVKLKGTVHMEFCPIPQGEFKTHEGKIVSIPEFWLGRFEVTQAQWRDLMTGVHGFEDIKTPTAGGGSRNKLTPSYNVDGLTAETQILRPVEQVTRSEAQLFCAELTSLERRRNPSQSDEFTLPTTEQWEYACRAGTTTKFHYGDALWAEEVPARAKANFGYELEDAKRNRTKVVGTYGPNAWGLYDMHGNVWELCLRSNDNLDGSNVVMMGGSYMNFPDECSSSSLNVWGPDQTKCVTDETLTAKATFDKVVGFRVALVRKVSN